jgi:SEC-C motif domain protein
MTNQDFKNIRLELCPCKSSKLFSECCEPYLNDKKSASSPLELMRSRYSAFVLKNIDYLLKTQCKKDDPLQEYQEIKAFATQAHFQHLEIISSDTQSVEFKAYYILNHHQELLHEKSFFTCKDGIWCYKEGELYATAITFKRNETCICGSGKKYKKCCGLL